MSQQAPSISWEPVLFRVAAALHVAAAQLPDDWSTLASAACKDASEDFIGLLALKGYSAAQIAAADQLASWVERRAFCLTMMRGTALCNYPLEQLKGVDPYEMVEKASVILISRVPTAPLPGGSDVGGVASGQISAVEDALCDARRRHLFD